MSLTIQQNAKALLKNYLLNFFKQNLSDDHWRTPKDRIEYICTSMCATIEIFKLLGDSTVRYEVERERGTNYNLITFFCKNSNDYVFCILENAYVVDVVFNLEINPELLLKLNL